MAMKKITFEIEFERTDDTSKRLPTTQCARTAFSALASLCAIFCTERMAMSQRDVTD